MSGWMDGWVDWWVGWWADEWREGEWVFKTSLQSCYTWHTGCFIEITEKPWTKRHGIQLFLQQQQWLPVVTEVVAGTLNFQARDELPPPNLGSAVH